MPIVAIPNTWSDVNKSLKDRRYPVIEHLEAHGYQDTLRDSVIIPAKAVQRHRTEIQNFLKGLKPIMFGRYEFERRPYQNYRRYLGLRLTFACVNELVYTQMRFGDLQYSYPDEE